MKYLGSKTLETDNLVLKAQTMNEQKRIWEILMIPEVNRYYLVVPVKFRDKLTDWDKQEKFYIEGMEHANDKNVFKWSIFLKDTNECIGIITCHDVVIDGVSNDSIRDVGWMIDPKYQGKGYGTEAARAMLDFMFNECEIEKIETGAAVSNPASWKIMEKLGFIRNKQTKNVQYTFLDELTELYLYTLTKEQYLLVNKNKD